MGMLKSHCGKVDPATAALYGLAGFGLLSALSVATSALRFLWRKHLRPGKKLRKYGEWALVTGASDGIGRAYCNYLAKQGLNIFLVSRTQSKLETAQAEIAEEYGVKTKILSIDLVEAGSQPLSAAVWADLKATIDTIDVGVLINNAAQVQGPPAEFHEIDPDSLDSTVSINTVAVLKVTHLVLPGMVNRGRGAIVNVSSVLSSMAAAPLVSLYSATKAFMDTFTKAIAEEYGPKGIDVQVQLPGPVATSMVRAGTPESCFNPRPGVFVGHAGRHIGYETVCFPYPPHAMIMGVMHALPRRLVVAGVKKGMAEMKVTMEELEAERNAEAAAAAAATASQS